MSTRTETNDSTISMVHAHTTFSDLTPREKEVLVGVVQGMSNQEIANSLYLSINSVKTYIRGAYRKIGASSRAQAVIWGVRNGLYEPQTAAYPKHL